MKRVFIIYALLFITFFFFYALTSSLERREQRTELEELQKNYIYLSGKYNDLEKATRVIQQDITINSLGWENINNNK